MLTMILVLLASATTAVFAQTSAPRQEIANVAAFARLYGVVRYFYPSDAAAALDWNRFAVYGVRRVRAARNPSALETTLEELFMPLGPGIEVASTLPVRRPGGSPSPDASLVAWRYRGAGIATTGGPYRMKRTNRAAATANQNAMIVQNVRAEAVRGKAIRLRGRVRVTNPNVLGWAGLWLRVDRGQEGMSFFDNMQNRPVRDTVWREYVIEGTVASDATNIGFGALASGVITADVDAMDLAVRADGGAWTSLTIADPGFEAAPNDAANRWLQRSVPPTAYVFSRPRDGAAEGGRFLRVTVMPPKASSPEPSEVAVAGASVDVDLAPRLKARVRIALSDAEARNAPQAMSALSAALTSVVAPSGRDDVDVRLADVVVAWNVFRHFYPYWPETRVDWDARLMSQLDVALRVGGTRVAHRNALRALVAGTRDGHGWVMDVTRRDRPAALPIQLRVNEGKLVVIATAAAEVPVGAVVTAIDGVSAAERVTTEMRLSSGAAQWLPWRAAQNLVSCPLGSVVKLTLEDAKEPAREAALLCNATRLPIEPRPDSIAELEPGIWYVDLTRARMAQIHLRLQALARARGVVFDLRGYPTDAGFQILPYLIDAADDDRWMHVARIVGPFGQISAWDSLGWNLKPAEPHFSGRRVFLTDGRAISYAESVMGHVRDHKLATIIGSTTAGANGNVANFTVPGGFEIVFTGLRVTRHDGRSPHHLVGVQPDIPIEPTLAALRAGRDELLERALAVLRQMR